MISKDRNETFKIKKIITYYDDEESVRLDDHIGLVRSWCGMYVILIERNKDKDSCVFDCDKAGIQA